MIPKSIVIHHTASSRDKTTAKQVNDWHQARDFPLSSLGWHIGYHYLITGDGKVTQTRRDNEIGAHSPPNDGKVGICLTGNFNNEEPSGVQLESLNILVERLKKVYSITDIRGHMDFQTTECPGENLYKWVLEQKISWLKKLIEIILKGRSGT